MQPYSGTFDNELKKYKKIIDKHTAGYIKKREPALLYDPSRYALESGGKRIRGILAVLGYKLVNKYKFDNKIFFAASALEILHLFTLVHDDIMDNADSRRGRMTIHKKWDPNTAILSGDLLVGLAYDSMLKVKFPNLREALLEFNDALIHVCEGQAYDKAFEDEEKVSVKEYNIMIQKKTGKLIESSALIGAILGGANRNQLNALSKYGKLIGKAFQIKDDLLDIIANEKELGKNKFGDIRESKKTYFYVTAFETFGKKDLLELKKIFSNRKKTETEIKRVIELFNSNGLIMKAQDEISSLIKAAKKSLSVFPVSERLPMELLADKLEIRTF